MFSVPKEIKERYLRRRLDDIVLLKASIQTKSIQEFSRIGHQTSGNASNFGFDDLMPVALQMEELKVDQLESIGLKLIVKFEEITNRYIRELESPDQLLKI